MFDVYASRVCNLVSPALKTSRDKKTHVGFSGRVIYAWFVTSGSSFFARGP